MAEAVVSFVVERLGDLLIEEAKFIHGVGGEVQQIHDELTMMQAFLEDADARQNKEKTIHAWVADVRKLAYDAGDVLESYLVGVESKRRGGIKTILKRYFCILNEGVVLHNVGSDIQDIKTRISNLKSRRETYGIRSLVDGQEGSTSTIERRSELIRRTYSHVVEEDFVGLEGVVENLVEKLLVGEDRDNYYRVISICGMGGLGKSTLAKRIYDHSKVKNHFTSFAWVCISQQWQTKDILQKVLLKLLPNQRQEIMDLRKEELIKKLFEVQQNKACLIVLDDIWTNDAWDCLKHAFPMGKTGSKLLLTSRNTKVVTHVDSKGFLYLPRMLNEAESLELLKKKAFIKRNLRDGEDMESMEKLGRKMVKHCDGLPLAIVVLGGLLVTKKTLKEWEKVHCSIHSYLSNGEGVGPNNHEGVLWLLALSYKDLPYQLKPCFLYMGMFFEDSNIETEKLYQMWIAESMVKSGDQRERETMMDVAERYLGELAQRCMVQVIQDEYEPEFGRFKACRLHDLMRDMCLFMAKEEDFFKLVDFRHNNDHGLVEASSSSSNKARRLVIHCDREANGSGDVSLTKQTSRHLRSFLFFNASVRCHPRFWTIVRSHINDFKLLRVLAIEGLLWHSIEERNILKHYAFIKEICGLIHLRYLSFRRTFLPVLPSSITNLKNLETLDLRVEYGDSPSMATDLREMVRLRHLYLPDNLSKGFSRKWRLDGLVNLETLEIVDRDRFNINDLLKLTNLRKLKAEMYCELRAVEKIVSYLSTNPDRFRYSSLSIDALVSTNYEETHTALRQLLACGSLHELTISHCETKMLLGNSHDNNFNLSPSLTNLCLKHCHIREDPMPILEKFPNLRVLHLRGITSLKESICSAMGFPQLRYLNLKAVHYLEKWTVEKGAMPNLSRLTIDHCSSLEELPDGLRFVATLRELEIMYMVKSFEDRIRVIDGKEGADFSKIRHVPSIVIT